VNHVITGFIMKGDSIINKTIVLSTMWICLTFTCATINMANWLYVIGVGALITILAIFSEMYTFEEHQDKSRLPLQWLKL
jgi:hypothetical protein